MTHQDDGIREDLTSHEWTWQPSVSPEEVRRQGTIRKRRTALARGFVVACVGIAGAGALWQAPWSGDQTGPASLGGSGPMLTHADTPRDMLMALSTTEPLQLRDECLIFAGTVIVWPADAQWDESLGAVVLNRDQKQLVAPIDGNLPAGLGGGLMPINLAKRFLDAETETKVRACLEIVHQMDVLLVN